MMSFPSISFASSYATSTQTSAWTLKLKTYTWQPVPGVLMVMMIIYVQVLLQIADEFVDNVATFSCAIARHRKSSTLDAKDVQLYLGMSFTSVCPVKALLVSETADSQITAGTSGCLDTPQR